MTLTVYLDGEYLPESEARVSISDRGFLYGDGIFDTLRAYRGIPFRIEDHHQRILESAGALEINPDVSLDDLEKIIAQLLKENSLEEAYIRITLTRGRHRGDLSFDASAEPTLLVVARPVKTPSDDEYKRGISARLVRGIFNPPELARHKTISYLPYLMARQVARRSGAREAILIDTDGQVLEAATANVFIVNDNEVITPPPSSNILPGIARKTVLELLPEIGQKIKEARIEEKELVAADEVFLTNSIVEVLPVTNIEGKTVGSGAVKLARKILEAYRNSVDVYVTKGNSK